MLVAVAALLSLGSGSGPTHELLILLLVHEMCHIAVRGAPSVQHLLGALAGSGATQSEKLFAHIFDVAWIHVHVHVNIDVHVYIDITVVRLRSFWHPSLLFLFQLIIQIMEGLLVVRLAGDVRRAVARAVHGYFRTETVHEVRRGFVRVEICVALECRLAFTRVRTRSLALTGHFVEIQETSKRLLHITRDLNVLFACI